MCCRSYPSYQYTGFKEVIFRKRNITAIAGKYFIPPITIQYNSYMFLSFPAYIITWYGRAVEKRLTIVGNDLLYIICKIIKRYLYLCMVCFIFICNQFCQWRFIIKAIAFFVRHTITDNISPITMLGKQK